MYKNAVKGKLLPCLVRRRKTLGFIFALTAQGKKRLLCSLNGTMTLPNEQFGDGCEEKI